MMKAASSCQVAMIHHATEEFSRDKFFISHLGSFHHVQNEEREGKGKASYQHEKTLDLTF